jgi:hypothetical protein
MTSKMTDRPDLRHIAADIREALADADREALIDMLTYVFEEYVIESPPPMRTPPAATLAELAGLSFPELIQTLQAHLDHAELAHVRVHDDQVLVRAGGALLPLGGDEPESEPEPAPEPTRPPTSSQRPSPEPAPAAATRHPPPAAGSAPPAESAAPSQPPPARGGRAGAGGKPPSAPDPDQAGDDDASIRFSLLELD